MLNYFLKVFHCECCPQSIFMSTTLISPFSSILSQIIRFMRAFGLNLNLRRSVSLLLSAVKSDSLGRVRALGQYGPFHLTMTQRFIALTALSSSLPTSLTDVRALCRWLVLNWT